jgi:hypothetical protein
MCIYDTFYWVNGAPNNRSISAFLYPIIRIIWALNITGIIWMRVTRNGGLVNKLLPWKAFITLSRLTYSVFSIHAMIVWIYWGSRRDLVDMNNFSILSLVSGVLLMSYSLGAVFSLLFKSPFFELQRYLKLMREKRLTIDPKLLY